VDRDGGPQGPVDLSQVADAVPREESPSRYGNPDSYVVLGRRYHTLSSGKGYSERGIASWYGTKFHGRYTSSREVYDMYAMTAAHRSLPLPTYVRVTNLENGRQVIVRVNDRGPFHQNRLIDLSYAAASRLGIVAKGTGLVEIEAIDPSVPELEEAGPAYAESAGIGLYLQVGAFAEAENARRLGRRIEGASETPVYITRLVSDERQLYRVRIGPLGDVQAADRLVDELSRLGIGDSRVVLE